MQALAYDDELRGLPATVAGIKLRRLGEGTCVVGVGADLRRVGSGAVEDAVATAAGRGCEDFVFDLSRLRAYDLAGLRRLADLWRRLALLDCGVFVAATGSALTADLRRLPAQDAWSVAGSVGEALCGLLVRPVEAHARPSDPVPVAD
jgi:anti-anti-sigma regulatory factor